MEVFATIKGINAASGLFLKGDLLYVIGDNSSLLYAYNVKHKQLNTFPLLANLSKSAQIPKAEKPDFEALCAHENSLYILGSGSTPKRNRMIEFRFNSRQVIEHDLTQLYTAMKSAHAIADEDLNVEGAIYNGSKWYLFNRGNGSGAKNGVFIINGVDLPTARNADFIAIPLPKTNTISASFTDAVLYENQIYFIAAAEDTTSTYHDGKIMGSYMGTLDLATLKLKGFKKIADHQKFEGLTFLRKKGGQLEFLICEDSDSETSSTKIYKVLV
ncbi:MAG: hypothetical protein EOO07_00590 [Chitinophagaceae bacterium]|nr:MAG: hypothetical protein EOO07_00590 [Chitinophagaceae bacterium]